MTEIQQMQAQLVAAFVLSNEVNEAQPHARREALEALHSAIQSAAPMFTVMAAELMTMEDD